MNRIYKFTILLLALIILFNCKSEVYAEDYADGGLIPMEVASDDVNAGFEELMDIDLSYEDETVDNPDMGKLLYEPDSYDCDRAVLTEERDISEIRRYNSRDFDLITSIKNQGVYGSCWAHATMSQAETSAIMQNMIDKSIDLSELHLGYFAYSENNNRLGGVIPRVSYGSTKVKLAAGGNDYYSISELMNWHGIALEKDYPYSLASKNPSYETEKSDTHNYIVSDYYLIPTKNNNKEDVKKVLKNCIYKFGSVGWSFYSSSSFYYNAVDPNGQKYTSYSTISTNSTANTTNHAITVVGWDDDFPVENFKSDNQPSNPGAWIIKNSYGVSSSSDGYFYMSYEEPTLGTGNPASVVILKNDTSEYDNNYFNSNGITNDARVFTASSTSNKYANVYKASGKSPYEKIKAVSFVCNTAQNEYNIQLYRNPDVDKDGVVTNPKSGTAMLKAPVTGRTSYAGLTTVEIPEDVYLSHGDNVSVVVTLSSGAQIMYDSTYATRTDVGFVVSQPAILGKSFILNADDQFVDLNRNKTDGNGRYVRLNIITDDYEGDEDIDINDPGEDDEENPPVLPEEHKPNTWEFVGGKKYYYDKYVKTLKGWNSIKGVDGITRKYYFNEDGSVRSGIFKDRDNKSYYLANNISNLTKEEYKILKKAVVVERLILDKTSELYNPDLYSKVVNHGAIRKGEIIVGPSNEDHYYADKNGVLCSGWQIVLDDNGTKDTKDDVKTWKYYNTEENGFFEYSGYDSFVASGKGALSKSDYPHWVSIERAGEIGPEYYCFTSASKLAKGWATVKRNYNYEKVSAKYYFDKATGEMYRGWKKVEGQLKYFGEISGVYCGDTSKQSIKVDDGAVYCLSPGGKIKTGWQKLSYRYEVVNPETGLVSFVKKTGKYYFEPNKKSKNYGEMYIGFRTINGKVWYFSEDDELLSESADGTRGMVCTGVVNLNKLGVSSNSISRNGVYYSTAYNPEGTNTYYMLKNGGLGTGYIKEAVNEFGVKNSQKWTIYCNPSGGNGVSTSPDTAALTEIKYTNSDGSVSVRHYRYGEAIGGYTDGNDIHSFTKWAEQYSGDTPYHYDLNTGLRKKTIAYYHGGYYGIGIGNGKNQGQIETIESINKIAHSGMGFGPGMGDDVPELIYATMSKDYPLVASSYIDSERYLNAEFPDGTVIEDRVVYNPECDYVAGNIYTEGSSYMPGYKYASEGVELVVQPEISQEKIDSSAEVSCMVLNVKRVSENRVDYSAPRKIIGFDKTELRTETVTVDYKPATNEKGDVIQKRDGIVNVYDVEAYTKACYKWMCENIGAENIVLVGTSSGAATALALAQWGASEHEKALVSGVIDYVKAPANIITVSGWLDASLNSCNKDDKKQKGNGVDYSTLVYWGKRYTNVSTKPCTGADEENGATTDIPSTGNDQYIVNYPFASPVTTDEIEKENRRYGDLNNVTVFVAKKDPCRAAGNLLRKLINKQVGTKAYKGASYSDGHGYMFQKNSSNGAKSSKIIAEICGHE